MIIGAIGFIWLLFWMIMYEKPEKQKKLSPEELAYINSDKEEEAANANTEEKVSWTKLLGYKQTWAFVFGKFMTDGVWWFFLFWLPAFLKAQYGMVGTVINVPLAVVVELTIPINEEIVVSQENASEFKRWMNEI